MFPAKPEPLSADEFVHHRLYTNQQELFEYLRDDWKQSYGTIASRKHSWLLSLGDHKYFGDFPQKGQEMTSVSSAVRVLVLRCRYELSLSCFTYVFYKRKVVTVE